MRLAQNLPRVTEHRQTFKSERDKVKLCFQSIWFPPKFTLIIFNKKLLALLLLDLLPIPESSSITQARNCPDFSNPPTGFTSLAAIGLTGNSPIWQKRAMWSFWLAQVQPYYYAECNNSEYKRTLFRCSLIKSAKSERSVAFKEEKYGEYPCEKERRKEKKCWKGYECWGSWYEWPDPHR